MAHNGKFSPGMQASAVDYFYGRISRDEAESYLTDKGLKEGLFLLRESVTTAGNYALSICHSGRIHHYSIERQPDGTVMIPDGRRFSGPVELIRHHSQFLDGFLTKPKIPCSRPGGRAPMAWPGVTMLELEQILMEEAETRQLKQSKLQVAFGSQRQKFVMIVAAKLHKEQPWFHGNIDRERADRVMTHSGHLDGKYLVREKDRTSFALSISFQGMTKHYKKEKSPDYNGEKFAIEDGPTFDNLMDMIAHYHNKMDGLLCKLSTPCTRSDWKKKDRSQGLHGASDNPIYGGFIPEPGIAKEVFNNDEFDEPDTEQEQGL